MRKITRILVKRFWGLCALLLISLAVVVTVGRELAPQVSQYRADLENYLSRTMGVRVSIGAVVASWEGLSPELQLSAVEFTSPRGESILSVDTAYAEVSLLRSLINWQVAFGELEFVDIAVGFRQNADGAWTLPGLGPLVPPEEGIDINDPLDIFLLGDHIELRNAQFSFDFRTGHSSKVALPHLVLENSGDFHRLYSQAAVDRTRDVLGLVIEARGDPRDRANFTAEGYLRLQRFELDKALAALPGRWWDGLPDQEWRKGHELNLELWFDVASGMAVSTQGSLDIGELPVDLDQPVPVPRRTTARFAGHWGENGAWRLAFRDFFMRWENAGAPTVDLLFSSAGLGQPVDIQVEELALEPWAETLRQAGVLKGEALEALDALKPRGSLRNLKVRLAGARLPDMTLRGNLHNVAVSSWRGAPALEGVNGYVEATPLAGFVDLASDGLSMEYPTLYDHPLAFDAARGRVHWQIDTGERAVNVHSGRLSVSSDMGEGRGYFSLFVPFDFGSQPEELVLQLGLRDSQARFQERLVPRPLPKPLRDWLNSSVGVGRVSSGGFLYRGGLTAESAPHAAIQLHLNVEGADLAYHPDWPELKNATGTVWLDDRRVYASVDSARLLNSQVEQGRLQVSPPADGEAITLDISGRAVGNASDGLELVRTTPLSEAVGHPIFADWKMTGRMRTTVDLSIPLDSEKKTRIRQVDMDLREGRLAMGDLDLQFDNVAGLIRFNDEQGLHSEELRGTFWDEPVRARIGRADSAEERLLISLDASADVNLLKARNSRPELGFLQGKTAFRVDFEVPFGPAVSAREPAQLSLHTDLKGLAVDLPAPLGKTADESRSFSLEAPLGDGDTRYTIRYGDLVHGILSASEDGGISAAAIAIDGQASLPRQRRVAVSGRIPSFDLGQWQTVAERYEEYRQAAGVERQDNLPLVFDVTFARFLARDLEIADLQVSGEEADDYWQFRLQSDAVAGEARIYPGGDMPAKVELAHFHLPKSEPQLPENFNPFVPLPESEPSDFLADLDPASLPAVDFSVQSFSVGGEHYGTWSFQMRPTDNGLVASNIVGNVRGGLVLGMEPGQGAELFWDKVDGEVNSRFNGRFVTDNLGSVLQQWEQPHLLDSESSLFDARLSWPGSPAAISLTALQGDIVMAIKEGTFIRGAGEASTGSALLQLISFFNFDTWLRRLRLDFSDLTRGGTPFDTIEGALQFNQGKVLMNMPVVVNSNSSRFQMAGVVDLINSELDTKLVATIPVGGNLTFVAALAGMGLPTVAGMWLISKVFEEQIGKMSSLSFHVTGPLNDPDMDFVRLFDDDAVQQDASTEAP